MCALLLRAEADSSAQADKRRLALLLASLYDGVVDALKVAIGISVMRAALTRIPKDSPVTIVDVEHLPAVGQVALLDVLGEGDRGVTVDGDIYAEDQYKGNAEMSAGATYGCHPRWQSGSRAEDVRQGSKPRRRYPP